MVIRTRTIVFCVAASICLSLTAAVSAQQTSTRSRSNLAPKLKSNNEKPKSEVVNNNTEKQQQQQQQQQSSSSSSKQERSVAATNSSNSIRENPNGRLEGFVEDELPADFYEMPSEQLDLGMNATGRAPEPILNVAVLQNGQMVDSAINVHPGTPLEMVIYLDDKSAKVYGLLASFLKVQDDTFRQREEVIISNGCSIDTYIFGNFEPNPEDQFLRAKFRAFKFPDSNFVRFVGTVNVCIKQCAKVNCSGGRKKRSSQQNTNSGATNKVYTVSTVLQISNPILDQHQRMR